MARIWLGLIALFPCGASADTRTFLLRPQVVYRDLAVACESGPGPSRLYLTAETAGGRIVSAYLRKAELAAFGAPHPLTAETAASLRYAVDENGRAWLQRLTADGGLIAWILGNSTEEAGACRPSAPLVSVLPDRHAFVFETKPTAMHPIGGQTAAYRFEGKTRTGMPFNAWLRLYQAELPI